MAIQRRRTYSVTEVDSLVRASESRASRRSGRTGHAGGRHVLITNAELADRGDDLPLACAFVGTPEAMQAVTDALNSAEGQAALGYLDDTYPTGIQVRLEAGVPTVAARVSAGYDTVRVIPTGAVLVLLERIEEEAYFGLHVHTAFPILEFRRGGPAWLDSRGQWR